MTQSAEILAYSQGPYQKPLLTFEARYPKFIHAEALTHRILEIQPSLHVSIMIPDGLMYDQNLSRNASSSRAIPVKRLIDDVIKDPVIPIRFGKNRPGMQASEDFAGQELFEVRKIWLAACQSAVSFAQKLSEMGVHKQIVNRIIEPFSHIKVVITGTEWNNFFALRSHKDAQPEIFDLSNKMQNLMMYAKPKKLALGEWHLPYIEDPDWDAAYVYAKKDRITRDQPSDAELTKLLQKVSVARCARTSFRTHEGKVSLVEDDIKLFEALMVAVPLHASPAEHQATPDSITSPIEGPVGSWEWDNKEKHGNLQGYVQLRKLYPNEAVPG
jgi:hypothetical protein